MADRTLALCVVVTGVMGLVVVAGNVAQFWILAHAVDALWAGAPFGEVARAWAVPFGAAFVVRAVAAKVARTTAFRAARWPRRGFRHRIIAHLRQLGPAWLNRGTVGEVSYLTTDGAEALEPLFGLYLPQLIVGIVAPIGITLFVMSQDRVSGLVLLAVAPTVPLVLGIMGSRLKSVSRRYVASAAELTDRFIESLRALPVLALFGAHIRWGDRIARDAESLRVRTMRLLAVNQLVILLTDLLFTAATTSAAILLARAGLLDGRFGLAFALFLVLVSVELIRPLSLLGAFVFAGALGRRALARARAFLSLPPTVVCDASDPPSTGLPRSVAGNRAPAIEVRGLSFSFPHDGEASARRSVLREVSFTVPSEGIAAIVGPSGCGKSTLLYLIQRWYDPGDGAILFDGIDIRTTPLGEHRDRISVVAQETHLFAGTLRENLLIADPEASDETLIRRLTDVGLPPDEFARGLDTEIGERAARVSGGQAQRIGLARALLRNAPVLLLDEPTAHLDPITEQTILSALERAMEGRTVLLVSHPEPLCARADVRIDLSSAGLTMAGAEYAS